MNPPSLPVRRPLPLLFRLAADRRGATAIEYGLIIALVTLAMLVGFTRVAEVTIGMWGNVSTKVEGAR